MIKYYSHVYYIIIYYKIDFQKSKQGGVFLVRNTSIIGGVFINTDFYYGISD